MLDFPTGPLHPNPLFAEEQIEAARQTTPRTARAAPVTPDGPSGASVGHIQGLPEALRQTFLEQTVGIQAAGSQATEAVGANAGLQAVLHAILQMKSDDDLLGNLPPS